MKSAASPTLVAYRKYHTMKNNYDGLQVRTCTCYTVTLESTKWKASTRANVHVFMAKILTELGDLSLLASSWQNIIVASEYIHSHAPTMRYCGTGFNCEHLLIVSLCVPT